MPRASPARRGRARLGLPPIRARAHRPGSSCWNAKPSWNGCRPRSRLRTGAPAGWPRSRAPPGSARRACSPRRAPWGRRAGCACLRRAAASSSARSRTGSCAALSPPSPARVTPSAPASSPAQPGSPRRCSPAWAAEHRSRADEDAAFAKLHGLYWLSANLADHAPLLVVIDDLHWADSGSLRWLAYLAHRIESSRPRNRDTPPPTRRRRPRSGRSARRPRHADRPSDAADRGSDGSPRRRAHLPRSARRRRCRLLRSYRRQPVLLRELLAAVASRQGDADPADLVADVRRMAPEVVSRRVRLQLAKLGTRRPRWHAPRRCSATTRPPSPALPTSPGLAVRPPRRLPCSSRGPRSSSATRRFGSRIRCYAEPSTTPCPHRSVGRRRRAAALLRREGRSGGADRRSAPARASWRRC